MSKVSPGVATALDQAWLSVVNLAIALAFVRYASKQEYGIYLLLMTPVYLVQGLQNALLLSPINTLLPASETSERARIESTSLSSLAIFSPLAGAVAAMSLAVYEWSRSAGLNAPLTLAFGLAVCGYTAREGLRSYCYAKNASRLALRSDLIYGLGLLAMIAGLSLMDSLTAVHAFAAMAIAALWPYALQWRKLAHCRVDRDVIGRFWKIGRWALVGVVVTWINLNAYPLIVGVRLDVAAVAEINAARLFMMPIALGITAWSNMARPRISRMMAGGLIREIRDLSVRSVAAGLGLLLTFVTLVWLVYPWIEPVLGKEYVGLRGLVVLWAAFFAVTLTRTVLMASLMTDEDGYRQLQQCSWYALALSPLALWFLTPYGAMSVLLVLIAVESLQAMIILRLVSLRWSPVR